MENIPTDLLSLSPVVLVFLFFIYEYFKNQKKKNGDNDTDYSKIAAQGISNISENHLNHIESAIREGDSEIVKSINDMHLNLASRLSELKGQIK